MGIKCILEGQKPLDLVNNNNLLINSDFRNPVNRNGKTEYTGAGCSIDKWIMPINGVTVTLTNEGIKILSDAYDGGNVIYQETEFIKPGILVTFSALYKGSIILCRTGEDRDEIHYSGDSFDIATFTYITQLDGHGYTGCVIKPGVANQELIVQAVKLELGPTQTLAHQDATGNWVLNDLPNYTEQYALCEQYSPTTGEWVGNQHSNPNLLDNWYFIGGGSQQGGGQFPINQRGLTEYVGLVYTIDRWLSNGYPGNGTITLHPDGIAISQNTAFDQRIGNCSTMENELYAVSIFTDTGLHTLTILIDFSLTSWSSPHHLGDSWNFQFCADSQHDIFSFRFYNSSENAKSKRLKAVKIERGSVQTLAHKDASGNWVLNDPPPNYQQELFKCQFYFRNLLFGEGYSGYNATSSADGNRLSILLPLENPMASTPAITKLRTFDTVTTEEILITPSWGYVTNYFINSIAVSTPLTGDRTYCIEEFQLSSDL